MVNAFIEFLSDYVQLTSEEIFIISNHLNTKFFKKGSILLSEGETAGESYFILKGCVTSYYLVDGEIKVSDFFLEKQPVTPASYATNEPSEYYLECIEDCTIAIATKRSTEELLKLVPRLAPLGSIMLEDLLSKQKAKYGDFILHSPENRYQILKENSPELLMRVPQYLIASYLGIKPESLSRIRKRLKDNDNVD